MFPRPRGTIEAFESDRFCWGFGSDTYTGAPVRKASDIMSDNKYDSDEENDSDVDSVAQYDSDYSWEEEQSDGEAFSSMQGKARRLRSKLSVVIIIPATGSSSD